MPNIYPQDVFAFGCVNIQGAALFRMCPIYQFAFFVPLCMGKPMHYDHLFPKPCGPKGDNMPSFNLCRVIPCLYQHKRICGYSRFHAVCENVVKPVGNDGFICFGENDRNSSAEGNQPDKVRNIILPSFLNKGCPLRFSLRLP